MNSIKAIENDIPEYWEGKGNMVVRMYTYAQIGLNSINNLKYLVAAIVALYVVLKFTNPLWMLMIGVISMPCLVLIGRWQLYRVNKIAEYITTSKGSVLGYDAYNIQIKQNELLEEILKELKSGNK